MATNNHKLIIITAPSGAGKSSITRYLINKYPKLTFSVSAATRQPRPGEVHGEHYYFISVEEFQQKIKDDAFTEWEMVYEGRYYGTLKSELFRIWEAGKTPVLDIDVQGAIHVQQQYKGKALSIFIEPPSIEELERRLRTRATETPESIAVRLGKANYEISFRHQFNKIVVNDMLEKACTETEQLIKEFLGS
ncbi:guanylate kinase [soil metagenome]